VSDEIRGLWPDAADVPMTDDDLIAAYRASISKRWLRCNFVASVDGAVTVDGLSGGLGSTADKRVFDLLRMLADGLMVGAGTLRAEGYGPIRLPDRHAEWRIRHGMPPHPRLVVVTGRFGLTPGEPYLQDAPVRPIVVTTEDAVSAVGKRRDALTDVADVIPCGRSTVDLGLARRELERQGIDHVLSEGGPRLLGALVAAGEIDELCLTVSAQLAGPGAGRIVAGLPGKPERLSLAHVLRAEDELLLRYLRMPHTRL
jgi:riboflavin biosynthesis pyrimidine reductase